MPTAKTEDYLEAMLELTREKGYIRVKDIADKLGVRPPSVTEMLKKLDLLKNTIDCRMCSLEK